MKSFIAAALFVLLVGTAASAETLTITLTTPGGPLTMTRTISGVDLNKLQTAYSAGLVAAGVSSPTSANVFAEMTRWWVSSTIDYVRDYYDAQARATVPSITVQ